MEAKKKFIVNFLFYGIILLIVFGVGRYILPIMGPFVVAFCVASLVHVLTRKMKIKRERLRRLVSIALCTVFYALLFAAIFLLGAKLVSTLVDVFKKIPGVVTDVLIPWLDSGAESLETAVKPLDTTLATWIDQMTSSMVKSISQFVTDFSTKAVVWVTSSATSIPGMIVNIVIMVVSSFFMVIDYGPVCAFLMKCIPSRQRELLKTSLHYAKTMILVYIKSYSILFLLTFAEMSIGFLILGVHNAIILALLIAVLDVLPILGTGGFLLPWALVMLIMENYKMAFGLLAIYLVITGIRNTLEPKMVGKQIGLHPLATLVAMLLGLRLFGLLGMIGLPVVLTVANAMRRTKRTEGQEAKVETAAG